MKTLILFIAAASVGLSAETTINASCHTVYLYVQTNLEGIQGKSIAVTDHSQTVRFTTQSHPMPEMFRAPMGVEKYPVGTMLSQSMTTWSFLELSPHACKVSVTVKQGHATNRAGVPLPTILTAKGQELKDSNDAKKSADVSIVLLRTKFDPNYR
jgi:hypothetical protein